MFQICDVVRDIPYYFRPVVHLRTGGAVALEVHVLRDTHDLDHFRPVSDIAERLIRLDAEFAAEAIRRAAEHRSLLPLHLSLWADTVCAERDPLQPLLATLADLGREPSQVMIKVVVPPGAAAPNNLETGLARLRAAGFGLGLDAAGTYPMMTLLDARPDALFLAARHTRGLPVAPTAHAVLACSVALATQSDATLIADGCDTVEQAAALRARKVHLVQGQLLGPSRRRPHTVPVPALLLDQRTTLIPGPDAPAEGPAAPAPGIAAAADSTSLAVAADLVHPAATMPCDITGETVRRVFAERPHLTSLVLVDENHRPRLSLNRDRFMIAFSGPFGYALHAKRPAAGLADPPRILGLDTSLTDVIDMVSDTPIERMYDDLIVIDNQGRCQGVLRVGDLVRECAARQRQ